MMMTMMMTMMMAMMMPFKMIEWEEFCERPIMCNVDTGGQPDNEANSPVHNLYEDEDDHDHDDPDDSDG